MIANIREVAKEVEELRNYLLMSVFTKVWWRLVSCSPPTQGNTFWRLRIAAKTTENELIHIEEEALALPRFRPCLLREMPGEIFYGENADYQGFDL